MIADLFGEVIKAVLDFIVDIVSGMFEGRRKQPQFSDYPAPERGVKTPKSQNVGAVYGRH